MCGAAIGITIMPTKKAVSAKSKAGGAKTVVAAAPKPVRAKRAASKRTKPLADQPAVEVMAAPFEAEPAPAIVETADTAATAEAIYEIRGTKSQEGTFVMKNQTNDAVVDRVQAIFGDVNERARTAFEKNAKIVEELTELTRGNVEAIVASSKVAAKGVEALSQEAAEYGRKNFEEVSTALRSFAEVKSPTDLFRLQSELAKSQFDSIVAESSKLSEAMIKLAGEVFEPLSSRYSVAAERVKNVVAA
jgi:phasin family protein